MHEQKVVDGKVFIDRDGEAFKDMLNYLRNGMGNYPKFDSKQKER